MADNKNANVQRTPLMSYDHLKHFVEMVEEALACGNYVTAAQLIEDDPASAWFGFRTDRFYAIVGLLLDELSEPGYFLRAGYATMSNPDPKYLLGRTEIVGTEEHDPRQQYFFAVFIMSAFRAAGLHKKAVEHAEAKRVHQGGLVSVFDKHGGWALNTSVQLGISAMLAGDFHRAIAAFSEAQLHVEVPAFAFLTRDALVKSALIQASFGDEYQAQTLLDRAEQIPRTASWAEKQIDVHRDFTQIMLQDEKFAKEALEKIQLHDVGEMWPFYIVAIHQLLGSAGHRDDLEYQLQTFEALPLPKTDGHGFAGSIVPLKRALLAMGAGRGPKHKSSLAELIQIYRIPS